MSWEIEFHNPEEHKKHDKDEQKEIELLKKEVRLEREELKEAKRHDRVEEQLLRDIRRELGPHLSFIKVKIGGTMPVGPITAAIGDQLVASVQGFDQNGAPFAIDFTNPANAVTYTDDNEASVASTPNSTNQTDALNCVAAGVANIGATCAGFSDTETVTVAAAAPVLSSIKVSLDPAGSTPVAAARRR
jgi:hypothetical protein